MSFLRKLFNRGEPEASPAAEGSEPDAPCPHVALVPHWDNADDMGNNDRVTRYTCEGCHSEFSREEGQRLLAAEKERLAKVLGDG